jgi:phosphoribosyl 1,2-cyclic phosphodiesterase
MKCYCLASSSAGNCYLLEFDIDGIPTRIMVECGIPLKDIYSRASKYNIDLSSIKCCLITHAHGDHSKAARDMNRLNIPLYAHKDTFSHINAKGEELVEYEPKLVCEGIKVLAFPVEHDIDGAVGFIIKTKYECVIFVNDHKRWTCDISSFKPDYVFIECNYDNKMVYAQYYELKKMKANRSLYTEEENKEVNIKLSQLERNINAHCSLHGTIKGLKKLNLKNTRCIFLMHLSDRYANEYKMKSEVQAATGVMTLVCGKLGGGIK